MQRIGANMQINLWINSTVQHQQSCQKAPHHLKRTEGAQLINGFKGFYSHFEEIVSCLLCLFQWPLASLLLQRFNVKRTFSKYILSRSMPLQRFYSEDSKLLVYFLFFRSLHNSITYLCPMPLLLRKIIWYWQTIRLCEFRFYHFSKLTIFLSSPTSSDWLLVFPTNKFNYLKMLVHSFIPPKRANFLNFSKLRDQRKQWDNKKRFILLPWRATLIGRSCSYRVWGGTGCERKKVRQKPKCD